MQIILGPFHPHLEEALVRQILQVKEAGPLTPLLILVPSDTLRRRLKILLAEEKGLTFLNLHLLTFHQLSRLLHEESHPGEAADLQREIFFEEGLRTVFRRRVNEGSPFSGLDKSEGGCAALWQTFRDLKDGLIDPDLCLNALREGYFGGGGGTKLPALLHLYSQFRNDGVDWHASDFTDLDIQALEQVPVSRFLISFHQIFYYGFYDLTQVQVDLFGRVAKHYPTTLFFPMISGHPGWIFAQRFYERYIQGLAADPSQIRDLTAGEGRRGLLSDRLFRDETTEDAGPVTLRCSFIHCSGARDEVLTAAKEIVRLVREESILPKEIGVVARNFEVYGPWIQEIFPRHGIPVTGMIQEPLLSFPLTKAVLLLCQLPVKDYLRSSVIDLLSSPYFNGTSFCPDGVLPRPDVWDLLTRRMGIVKGWEEWERLHGSGAPQEAQDQGLQAEILFEIVLTLRKDLESIPPRSSWSDYQERWSALLEKYLGLTGEDGSPPSSREGKIAQQILLILKGLRELDRIQSQTSRQQFVETLERWLERETFPWGDENIGGVTALDGMSARGIPFRILFILGMNEGVFPRVIREDAFLVDGNRREMETLLGYKVPEKMAGYDEEKLLFLALIDAARERLYLLHQRSDEAGNPATPSWYLAMVKRALGGKDASGINEWGVPRSFLEKREAPLFANPDLLFPAELAARLSLESRDPLPVLDPFVPYGEIYRHAEKILDEMNSFRDDLLSCDGVIGFIPETWDQARHLGFSPSALEDYAKCPFLYFSNHLLKLEVLQQPEEGAEQDRAGWGRIWHAVLRDFYQGLLIDRRLPGDLSPASLRSLFEKVCREVFAEYEWKFPVAYPLLWEIEQSRMKEWFFAMIEQDLAEMQTSGYRPVALEISCTDRLPEDWPDPLPGLILRGRMDRIDGHPPDQRYRVVDYKFTGGKTPKSSDRDLLQAALRGERLQLPLYQLLTRRWILDQDPASPSFHPESFLYFLAPRWSDGPFVTQSFPADGWDGETGGKLRETLAFLIRGIREGRFYIFPGSYCDYCDFRTICRNGHGPTRWRQQRSGVVEEHRLLRTQKVFREKKTRN